MKFRLTINPRVFLFAILSLAVAVRYILLDQSFWMDEAAQAIESIRPLSQQLQIYADFQPPLYHLFVHFLSRVSIEESWLRLASLIPGVLTVILTYLIGKQVFKKKEGEVIGLLGALFLSLSSFHIFFSQELRPYALAAFFSALSWYFLLQIHDHSNKKNVLFYILSTVAGLYTMYVYPFIIVSQVLYCVFVKKNIKVFFIAWIISALFFLPWVPSFLEQFKVGSTLRTSLPGWEDVVSAPQWKALPLVFMKFVGGVVSYSHSMQSGLYVLGGSAFVGVCLLFGIYSTIRYRKVKQVMILLVWLFASVLGAWFVSFIVPVLSPKRVLSAQPAFFLLLAYSMMYIKKNIRILVVVVFALYLCVGIVWYWGQPMFQRERWRDVYLEVSQRYPKSSTVVVFGFDLPFAPWRFYTQKYAGEFPSVSVDNIQVSDPKSLNMLMRKVRAYDTVLLFDYLRDLTDPQRKIETWLEENGYVGVRSLDTINFGFIRVYQRGKTYAFWVQ